MCVVVVGIFYCKLKLRRRGCGETKRLEAGNAVIQIRRLAQPRRAKVNAKVFKFPVRVIPHLRKQW